MVDISKISLKPCPFCASKDVFFDRVGTHRVSNIIACNECGCTLESNEVEPFLGSAWNNRPLEKDSDILIEEDHF